MPKPAASVNYYKWNRKLLNAYWCTILTIFIASLIGAWITDMELQLYLNDYVLRPMILLCFTLGILELANRCNFVLINDLMIVGGTVITTIVVYQYSSNHGMQFDYLIPLLVSMYYFQKRKVLLSFVLNLCAFLLLYAFHPQLRHAISSMELLVTLASFGTGVIIALGIMSRGIEIQRNLIATIEQQQDLVVRSAIMERLSKTDALTDLYNHKTFHEYLDKLVGQAEKYGLPLQLAIFDIDNFKKINDTYGHWVGDIILKRVARTIKESVTQDDFVSRYGGEEFAVILTDKPADNAYHLCENARIAIADASHEELDGGSISISIGLQTYVPGHGKEFLFKGADTSLYRAKRTGKNKTVTGTIPIKILETEEAEA